MPTTATATMRAADAVLAALAAEPASGGRRVADRDRGRQSPRRGAGAGPLATPSFALSTSARSRRPPIARRYQAVSR